MSEISLLDLAGWGNVPGTTADGQRFLRKEELEISRHWFSFLKDLGVDVNAVDPNFLDGYSWLLLALTGGDVALTHVLLHNGANVHSRTPRGESALHLAFSGSLPPHPSSMFYFTPHCDENLIILLALLLKAGCDPHARCTIGSTPFHRAKSVNKVGQWRIALTLSGYNLEQYIAIERGLWGSSTAISKQEEFEDRPTLRRRYVFEDE
jgi:hypothetical protein